MPVQQGKASQGNGRDSHKNDDTVNGFDMRCDDNEHVESPQPQSPAHSGRVLLADDIPPVDLNLLVVENRGLDVVDVPPDDGGGGGRSGGGRIIRAMRDLTHLPLYSPISRERPALICQRQDYMEYMERFLDAPVEVQLGILDMFYQPLDSSIGQSLVEPSRLLYLLGVLEDLTVVHQLLVICVTNGMQYRDQNQVAMALFGSKFNHSCHPNAAFSSMAEDGHLEYLLLAKEIRANDEVTISYLSDLFETPTPERRDLLWQTKSFVCTCPRCQGPDFCRCLPCSQCKEPVSCRYRRKSPETLSEDLSLPSAAFEPYWECQRCSGSCSGNDNESLVVDGNLIQLHQEREVARTLHSVEREIKSQRFSLCGSYSSSSSSSDNVLVTMEGLKELINDACDTLSPTHHLTIKALRLLVTASTTQAYILIKRCTFPQKRNILRVAALLRTSVLAGMQLVLAGECVAARCTGCYRPNVGDTSSCVCIHHTPLYDRATPMRHIVEDLVQLPLSFWPSEALFMAHRYHPILQAKFKILLEEPLEKLSQAWDTFACLECGIYWTGKLD